MKKFLTLTIIAIIALFLIATNVQATETVVEVSTAEQLSQELSKVAANGVVTIKLTDNIDVATGFVISNGENITIDLNGKNVTAKTLFTVTNGTVILKGNGTIETTEDLFYVNTTTSSGKVKVEVGANVKATTGYSGVYIKGANTEAHVYGSLKATGQYPAIQGNGKVTSAGTKVYIYDGAELINENSTAIYHPQAGELYVYGGTIKGTTGIEIRAGKLVVEGGNIIATANQLTVQSNGDGSTTIGAGIAIAQHTTALDTSVLVKGGNIQGYVALNQSDPEKTEAEDKVSIEISGGEFEATNGGTEAVYSENKTGFITGGTFSVDISEYLPEGAIIAHDGTGNYIVIVPVDLDTPTNLKWDGTKATWDAVPNAMEYVVILTNGEWNANPIYTEDTSFDFSKYLTDENGKYIFEVHAVGNWDPYYPSGFATSEAYVFPTEDEEEKPSIGEGPTEQEPEEEKDETPKTGSVDVVLFASVMVAVISVAGIVLVKKYTR